MVNLLLLSLITSLIITGIYTSTWDGMIFGRFRAWMDGRMNPFIAKPIYSCTICMSSVWGTLIYISAHFISLYFNIHIIEHWGVCYLPFIFIVAGINTIISGIIYMAFERNTDQA